MKKIISEITVFLFLVLLCMPSGYANPQLDQITSGSGSVSVDGNIYNFNQSSDKVIADFHSFNIAGHEVTNIIQPSSSSAALFHINDANPSQIFGGLNANGNLFLTNPNGIIFGEGAQVNVGSLVASTLEINDADFLGGNYTFTANDASGIILNQGSIQSAQGGYIALLGRAVSNSGSMTTQGGSSVLSSAEQVTLSLDGDGLVSVAIDEAVQGDVFDFEGNRVNEAITNSGNITAAGGRVILSSNAVEEIFDYAINHTGMINATSVIERNGEIYLVGGDEGIVSVEGSLDASGKNIGENGGTILLLGDKVGLFGDALVDVSGYAGGGTVLVGGDTKGENPLIPNATATYAGSRVVINADAIVSGNGGKVILWGNEVLRTSATISARGGAISGNGGFVETSSKYFEVSGNVDVTAPNGEGGTWLLDPTNLEITGATSNTDDDAGNPTRTFSTSAAGTPATLDVATLNTALETTGGGVTAIIIDTISGLAEAGNITITSAITKAAGGAISLTFNATNNILLNNNITSTTGALSIIFNPGGVTTLGADVVLTALGGAVTFNNDVSGAQALTVNSGGGDINFNGIGTAADPTALTITAGTGAVTFSTASNNVAGNVLINSAGNINFNTAFTTTGGGTFTQTTGSGTTNIINVQLLSAGNVDINNDLILFTNGGNISSAANTVALTAETGTILGGTAANDVVATTIDLDAVTGIGTGGGGALEIQATTVTADSSGAGNVVIDSNATAGTTFTTLTAGTGTITLTQTGNQTLGVTTSTTTDGAITISNTGANLTATTVTAGADTGSNDDVTLTTVTSGDVIVGNVTAANDQVTITSAAGIEEDGTADAGADITATTIDLNGTTGIGDDARLEIAGSALTIDSTGAGNIDVDNAAPAATTVTTLTAATGTITFVQDGNQTLAVTTATTTDGAISISNTGANLTATTVTAGADTGSNDDVTLTTVTSGDVIVGNVTAANDQVTVTSAAGIEEDGTADAGADITATTIDLNGATGIGDDARLEISGSALTIDSTGAGNIDVDNAATVATTVTTLTAGTGTINFIQDGNQTLAVTTATTTDGAITIQNTAGNLTATTVTAGADTGSNDDVTLTTLTSGDVLVDNVTATNDVITINSVDNIFESGTDAGADLTATTVTLTASNTDIGTVGNPIEVSATTLNTTATNVFTSNVLSTLTGLFATAINSVVAGNITVSGLSTTGAGSSISVTSTGGNVTVDGVSASSAVNISTPQGDILGGSGDGTDVSGVGQVNLTAGGVIGTTSNPVSIFVTGSTIYLSAGGEVLGLSANVTGNVNRHSVEVLGIPTGLVLYNNHIIGGAAIEIAGSDLSGMFEPLITEAILPVGLIAPSIDSLIDDSALQKA